MLLEALSLEDAKEEDALRSIKVKDDSGAVLQVEFSRLEKSTTVPVKKRADPKKNAHESIVAIDDSDEEENEDGDGDDDKKASNCSKPYTDKAKAALSMYCVRDKNKRIIGIGDKRFKARYADHPLYKEEHPYFKPSESTAYNFMHNVLGVSSMGTFQVCKIQRVLRCFRLELLRGMQNILK